MMSSVRKWPKLSPSKTAPSTKPPQHDSKEQLAPPTTSHNALLFLPVLSEGGEEGKEIQEEEEGYLLVEEDTTDSSLVITMEESQPVGRGRRKGGPNRKRRVPQEEEETGASESEEEVGVEVEIDRQLDQSLETKSKQHNLTTVNVKNILHEVITNEHVVAMMKAAINETEAVPAFEPKMTRSKFKEVVEKGVVIPAWNISPIKKSSEVKAPQFVDIPLAEEDSSDEEYHPEEEEEDETAEDTFQESDLESTASSPRGSRIFRQEEESWSPWQSSRYRSRCLRAGSVSMGPPPTPQAPAPRAVTDSSFLEKLHAVEEELAVCMEPYQPLSDEGHDGMMAYRTRSKRPLRNVPLGRLEAELRAPDITPDMYDSGTAHEDRDWTNWLRGLMSSDVENEEECDDEDDPEYNFLADIDEPDQEDYRDDKAVRITKKEVNELMEELFETLKEDLTGRDVDDEGHEEEEEPQDETQTVNAHTVQEDVTIRLDKADAEERPILELRTVKQQLALIRQQRKRGSDTHTHCPEPFTLTLDHGQKARLQQQLQQHVQLLTQVHLLTCPVPKLHSEAETTRQFLFELDFLAQRGEMVVGGERPGFTSTFRAPNLQEALKLLEELRHAPISYQPKYQQPNALGRMRQYPVMPAQLAWLFAVRSVFLYPQLLPCASLDPALYCPRRAIVFTAAEDCLLVLGLRAMEGTSDPAKLVSQFLLRKSLAQIKRRILQCCRPGCPDNLIKAYRYQRVVMPMPVACGRVNPGDLRPPVEREENILPLWLARSLPVIYPSIKQFNSPSGSAPQPIMTSRPSRVRRSHRALLRSGRKYSFPTGTRYPPRLPDNLDFQRMGFVLIQSPGPSPSLPAPPKPPAPRSFSPSLGPLHRPRAPPTSNTEITQCSPHVLLHRLPKIDSARGDSASPAVMSQVRERITWHYRTFASLRRRPLSPSPPLPDTRADRWSRSALIREDNHRLPPLPTPSQQESERDEQRESEGEQEEGGSEVDMPLLALSESSCSPVGSTVPGEADSEEEEGRVEMQLPEPLKRRRGEMMSPSSSSSDESTLSVPEEQETMARLGSEGNEKEDEHEEDTLGSRSALIQDDKEDDDEDAYGQTEKEELAFAQDYVHRVCEVILGVPGQARWLLEVLEGFREQGEESSPVELYYSLAKVLEPWPRLLQDYAAFLTEPQAQRCGLVTEQRLFQRSRRFLRELGRCLGEGSSCYQELVSVLQGGPAPGPDDIQKISYLLKDHAHIQQEFWEFFSELYTKPFPMTANSETTSKNPASQSARRRNGCKSGQQSKPLERRGKRDVEEEDGGQDGEEDERKEEKERGVEREDSLSVSRGRPVCAKNISLTPTGEKVVLWTREADRAILTACQQKGANQKTFRLVSAQLGNKTAKQVSSRFQDLMKLFHSAAQKPISCLVEDNQPIGSQEAAPD
ncbi:GON-4-like protein [Lampris incognitus]|uniref:GON-4-like protein n=1 Tax=Lampris incognitus TaxID=2546036 RepID=UPI0024B5D16C|nr:GON-4-like protein [Lampris incognitus]